MDAKPNRKKRREGGLRYYCWFGQGQSAKWELRRQQTRGSSHAEEGQRQHCFKEIENELKRGKENWKKKLWVFEEITQKIVEGEA